MSEAAGREQVLRYRVQAQQLDRRVDARAVTDAAVLDAAVLDAAVLDAGVQDTGPDGALWALALRGVPVTRQDTGHAGLALAWTVRGAPHLYRRDDLPAVAAAVRPFSEADAAKRIYDAARPLRAAGIGVGEALAAVGEAMQGIVTAPTVKGEVSSRLTAVMPEPYLRWCRPCQATHLYEMPFRLAALHAGLDLGPGTSPPVLRPVPGWPSGTLGALRALSARDRPPDGADEPDGIGGPDGADRTAGTGGVDPPSRLDVVRTYLHLCGPATTSDVAAYLDAPVKDVSARLAALRDAGDVADVEVEGAGRLLPADDLEALRAAGRPGAEPVVRLLGPFDLFLQVRDRALLVPDADRRKELWPTLGRPGAVLVNGEVVGTWRPRTSGSRLRVRLDPWTPWAGSTQAAVDEQIAALAAFRGLDDGGRA